MPTDIQAPNATTALVCNAGKLQLTQTPLRPLDPGEILIDVTALGLCRTDLYAINGEIETATNCFIPGHEFAGIVAKTSSEMYASKNEFEIGDRVVVNPVISCGACIDCESDKSHLCSQAQFMGVDLDGACCGQVIVSAANVFPIPAHLSCAEAAFAEPVAATLAILNANISPKQSGLIVGESRISILAQRVLSACGFANISILSLQKARTLSPSQFDFVIETDATTEVIAEMARLVRPRGTLILKSRQHRPLEIQLLNFIRKEPTISAVNYGPFPLAVQLLAEGKVKVDDLIGQNFPLSEFELAFKAASAYESKKIFLIPGS